MVSEKGQLTRDEIVAIILEASTKSQVDYAWMVANDWRKNNPDDLVVRQACEQLISIEEAINILESNT